MTPIILALGGVLVGVFVKSLGKYIKIPYTVVLFIVGICVGIARRAGGFEGLEWMAKGIDDVANLDPNFVLYVFLPILIFAAAYDMNLHVFRKNLLNASVLAGPGLVICMFLTGALLLAYNLIFPGSSAEWTWKFALMFGALISATDPVAVVALLQELKTSKKFSTLVDGESLLNDGTGIVCFMVFYGAFVGHASEMNPLSYFIWVCGGSCLIGYLIALVTIWFTTMVNSDEIAQNCITIIAAYLTFIVAQFSLDISGVIALVVYGLTFAQKGRPLFKASVNEFMSKFWGLLAHIANTLIFIIVGIIIAGKIKVDFAHILQLIVLYIALMLIRYAMIAILYPAIKRCGYGLSLGESIILGWGGLRGALGMSLALMVHGTQSIPLEIREDVLFFTAGIVTLTLCINATTSKWLLGKLNLIKASSVARNKIDAQINNYLVEADKRSLEKIRNTDMLNGADLEYVAKFIPEYIDIPEGEEEEANNAKDIKIEVRNMLLESQRNRLNLLYTTGILTKPSFVRLQEYLEDMADGEGELPLNSNKKTISIRGIYFIIALFNLEKAFGITKYSMLSKRIGHTFDRYRGFQLIQMDSMEVLNKYLKSDIITNPNKEKIISELKEEIQDNLNSAENVINELKQNFADAYTLALTKRSARILLASEKDQIGKLVSKGVITTEDGIRLTEDANARQRLV